MIGFGGTGVTMIVGTMVGLLAGYFGGRLDTVLMRIVDVFFAFPFLVLVLAIVAMLGPGLFNLFIAIWAVGWVSYARIIRGETLVAKKQEYVLAARALGYSHLRIMVRHILPNVISAALIFSMADAVGNILLGAALGYLGLGVPPADAGVGRNDRRRPELYGDGLVGADHPRPGHRARRRGAEPDRRRPGRPAAAQGLDERSMHCRRTVLRIIRWHAGGSRGAGQLAPTR